MAEGGEQPGCCHFDQPLEFNWVGCDVCGRDLLDLEEADGELLNIEGYSDEVEGDLFLDINVNREPNEGRQLGWGPVEEAHFQGPRIVPKNVLSEGSTSKSARYPPTLLQLEVQALAKIGVVKLYQDSRDLEKEEARAEEERKLAIVDRFDRQRQDLSPLHGQRQVEAPERGDLVELEKVALSSKEYSVHRISTPQTSGGTDLLELQKVALSSMNGIHKSASEASTPDPLSPPNGGDSDLLELQKAALSNMKGTSPTRGPGNGTPSNADGDESVLQKVAMASTKKSTSEDLHSHSPYPVPEPVPQSTTGGDLLELQRRALTNMRNHQNEPSSTPAPVTLQTTASTKSRQQAAGCSSSKQEKEDVNYTKMGPPPAPLQGCPCLLPLQNVITPQVASATQRTGGGHLSELQKLAMRNMQQAKSGAEFSEAQNSHRSVPSGTTAIQVNHLTGGDLLDQQNVASNTMISSRGAGKKNSEDIEPKQQNNTKGVGGTPSSSPNVFNNLSVREPLDTLLEELSSKDQALQSANRIIEERNQLLQEYEGSLANALNLLESISVRCTDSKETGNVLTEAKEIFQNLSQVFNAFENFDCLVTQCGKGIHCLEGPTIADNNSFLFGIETGLGVSQQEIDERRNLLEELLKELSTIEVTRKEAQYGFQLQMQRNEQLIAELQKLDLAPTVFNAVPSIFDSEHAEVKPHKIAKDHEGDMVSTEGFIQQTSEHPSEHLKGNLHDHPSVILSDQAHNNLCGHAYEDTSNPAEGNLIDHVYNNLCGPAYEDTSNPAEGNLGDHVYKGSNDESKGIICDHAFEDMSDQAKGGLCDHVYEYLIDLAKQNHQSNQAIENSGVYTYESPHGNGKEDPFDKASKKLCEHVYVNQKELVGENLHGCYYENPHDQCGENQHGYAFGYLINKANKNPCEHSREQTNEKPYDHQYDILCEQTSEYATEQTLEDLNDFAYEDGKDCGPIPKYAIGQTPEYLNDFGYEDGKDCGPTPKQVNIGYDSPTWMPPISDSQLTISSNEELLVSANLSSMERSHQLKTLKYISTISSPNALWVHLQHFVDVQPSELQSHEEQKAIEISELHKQINQLQTSLIQEQEKGRNLLLQKPDEAHHGPTKELEEKDKVIRKMQFQVHQLDAALRQEREEYREVLVQKGNEVSYSLSTGNPHLRSKEINELHQQLYEMQEKLQENETTKKDKTHSVKLDIDHLQARLHAKDEEIRELQEIIARKEENWQVEKHQMMRHFDDLETKLLVKEEENIKITHEFAILRSLVISPNGLNSKDDNNGSHFFHNQLREEGREILDLRCEVLSLQDCLGIKAQAINTMEKELARSYNIVIELRSKLRRFQESEKNSLTQGKDIKLIEKLRHIEIELHKCQNERAMMSAKIEDMSKRCKYLEIFEHLHKEVSCDINAHAIKELEKDLEGNFHLIQNFQTHCNEYGQPIQVEEELARKEQLLMKWQGDIQHLRKQQSFASSPAKLQPDAGGLRSTMYFEGDKLKSSDTNNMSNKSPLEHVKVESPDGNTLRELLRNQWRVQKLMEDRLNTMMAYVNDRVDEFEKMSPSNATSDSSFVPNRELNHFHVEAKLMKLQLEQQLQILQGTTFTSLSSSGVTSPRKYSQNCVSTLNLQLMNEKFALEDSAQTLQEKTSRLLNKLTFMRSEFGPNSC